MGIDYSPQTAESRFIARLAETNPIYELVSPYTGCKDIVSVRCTKCGTVFSKRADRFNYRVIPCPNCKRQSKRSEISWHKWNEGFMQAELYFKEKNNLFVPFNYINENGFKLGQWLNNQRSFFKANKLSKERIDRLNTLGMIWDKYQTQWDERYRYISHYYSENGSIYPLKELGRVLGKEYVVWIHTQTDERNKGKLPTDKISLLEQIEIKWDIKDAKWEEMYQMAKKYYETHCVSGKLVFTGNESPELHRWLRAQRDYYRDGTNSKFSEERIEKLNAIGMIWDEKEYSWLEHYQLANHYYDKQKHLTPTIEEDNRLYTWIQHQRKAYKAGKISVNRIELLEKIDMVWDDSNKAVRVSFPEKTVLFFLKRYYPSVEASNRTILDGKELDIFIPELSTAIEYDGYYHINTLDRDIHKDLLCKERGIKLIRIREATLPKISPNESLYIIEQKGLDAESLANSITQLLAVLGVNQKITSELIEENLKEIANTVNNHNSYFEMMYQKAESFYKKHGNLMPSPKENRQLSQWLSNLRTRYRNHTLSDATIKRLDGIGMKWSPEKDIWERNYEIAKQYYLTHGNLEIPRTFEIEGVKIGQWVKSQRNRKAAGKMPKEREEKLNEIQMIWNMKDTKI